MSRANRLMQLLDAMTVEERAAFFEEVGDTYCTACGTELPDEDSTEPDHDCGEDDEEDGGDDSGLEGGEDSEDDDDSDENANDAP